MFFDKRYFEIHERAFVEIYVVGAGNPGHIGIIPYKEIYNTIKETSEL